MGEWHGVAAADLGFVSRQPVALPWLQGPALAVHLRPPLDPLRHGLLEDSGLDGILDLGLALVHDGTLRARIAQLALVED